MEDCEHVSWKKEDDGSWTCTDCGLNKWEPIMPEPKVRGR